MSATVSLQTRLRTIPTDFSQRDASKTRKPTTTDQAGRMGLRGREKEDDEVLRSGDLAALYQVETKVLNQAVKRNLERFPADFMFQLTREEVEFLRSQIVTLETGRGKYAKYLPFAFTEQGVAMLSSVLKSSRAVHVNIEIMRALVRVREMIQSNRDLAKKLTQLEERYDARFRVVFKAIRQMMGLGVPAHRPIKGLKRE